LDEAGHNNNNNNNNNKGGEKDIINKINIFIIFTDQLHGDLIGRVSK
jgi:hypothetical protein